MLKVLRETWAELGRTIFVGERFDKNVRGIAVGSGLIIVLNIITGIMNVREGLHMAAISSLTLIIASLLIIFFAVRKKRITAITIATVAVVIIYGYDVVAATTPIMPVWTILLPWAFAYLASVRHGIFLSAFFSVLYVALFHTPLRQLMEGKYPEFILQRFALLYVANAFLCIFIMVQYHRNTLHQMDYAEELLKAKEAADKASEAKSSFLANMSHEIRTPINAVLGMNEMIVRESVQARDRLPEDREAIRSVFSDISNYAGNIESAGHNLLSIINDILDFSKIESGKMEIMETAYQFSSVLNDVSNMIAFKARDKGLQFLVDIDRSLPDGLCGDEVRVRQIITNLLNNAVKYTKEGSVTLSVRVAEGDEVRVGSPIRLVIAVRDTGIGIREEDLDKLFKEFERVDLLQNSTVEGTGLGLAITRSLLGMMGGEISVESVYGQGSTFSVVLPQTVVSAEAVGDFREKFEQSMRQAAVYEGSFRAPDARILIVDDTRMNLAVAVGLLKKTQLQIDTAASGAEAIDLTQNTRYDLILMDQRMPGMGGTEAMHCIRAQIDGANAETPFICLTADAVSGARERYLAEGFSDYLSKPIDSKALEKALIKYLPADKVLPGAAEEAEAAAPVPSVPDRADDGFAPLRAVGVAPETGLRYCQNDSGFYMTILREYADGGEEKDERLRRFYAGSDWPDYAIAVHALKSTSRMIGADALADTAARLEAAANEGNGAVIAEAHDAMLAAHAAVLRAIRLALPPEEASAAPEGDALEFLPEEDGVLEFLP